MNSSNPADISFTPKVNKNLADKNDIKEKFMKFKAQDVIFNGEESLLSFPEGQNEENNPKNLNRLPEIAFNFFNDIKDNVKYTDPSGIRNEAIPIKSYLFPTNK